MIFFLRSSMIGTLSLCEAQFVYQYILGFPGKVNLKATLGNVVHKAAEILALKNLALKNNQERLIVDDIGELTLDQCDDIEYITTQAFEFYKDNTPDIVMSPKDLRTCISWVYKIISFNDGELDPRNQNIFNCEHFFDFEVKKDWAICDYTIKGVKYNQYLRLKGTIDLILVETDDCLHIQDYKTGKRLDWSTGETKTQESLRKDPQLLLYFYALRNLFPDKKIIISIYYINDGGIFTFSFDDKDYVKAENMIRQKFEYIKNIMSPKLISKDNTHWKCKYLCPFSQMFDDNKTVCQHLKSQIDKYGIRDAIDKYADVDKITNYGSGGGRLND